jgi:hypothetical protein
MKTKIPKLSSLIKKQKFDWVNSDITDSLFETPKEISSDYELCHFDRYISSEDAIKEMEKDGYRPANAWELLSWKDWNGTDTTDTVVALGSVGEVVGIRCVPCIDGGGSGRSLYLYWFDDDWFASCRFLRVRNSSLKSSDTKNKALGNLDSLTLESAISKVKEAGYKIYKEI